MPDKKGPSFAETVLGKRPTGDKPGDPIEQEPTPSALARRGTGQDLMLELRFKDGRSAAMSYSYLARADYCPEKGISLTFSIGEVLIEGSNLRPIYNDIVAHRRSFVTEEPASVLLARSAESPTPQHVSKITIRKPVEEDAS